MLHDSCPLLDAHDQEWKFVHHSRIHPSWSETCVRRNPRWDDSNVQCNPRRCDTKVAQIAGTYDVRCDDCILVSFQYGLYPLSLSQHWNSHSSRLAHSATRKPPAPENVFPLAQGYTGCAVARLQSPLDFTFVPVRSSAYWDLSTTSVRACRYRYRWQRTLTYLDNRQPQQLKMNGSKLNSKEESMVWLHELIITVPYSGCTLVSRPSHYFPGTQMLVHYVTGRVRGANRARDHLHPNQPGCILAADIPVDVSLTCTPLARKGTGVMNREAPYTLHVYWPVLPRII